MKHVMPSGALSLLLCLIIFSACSPNGSDEKVIEFKRTGNEVVSRTLGDPDVLNPLLTQENTSKTILFQTHSFLLYTDLETYEYKPQLAKSYPKVEEITEGPDAGKIKYTFEIFENAVWDNGTPITGNDVVFTWKALITPGLKYSFLRSYFFL